MKCWDKAGFNRNQACHTDHFNNDDKFNDNDLNDNVNNDNFDDDDSNNEHLSDDNNFSDNDTNNGDSNDDDVHASISILSLLIAINTKTTFNHSTVQTLNRIKCSLPSFWQKRQKKV